MAFSYDRTVSRSVASGRKAKALQAARVFWSTSNEGRSEGPVAVGPAGVSSLANALMDRAVACGEGGGGAEGRTRTRTRVRERFYRDLRPRDLFFSRPSQKKKKNLLKKKIF
jgi:hypothetical protein